MDRRRRLFPATAGRFFTRVPGAAQHLKGVHARLRGLWWCAADHRSPVYPRSALKMCASRQAQLAWTVPVCGGPGSAVHRSTLLRAAPRPGHAIPTAGFLIPISRCQTAHLVPAARCCARGLHLCFAHPNRGVGGAPRDVRVQRHPFGVPSCVKDARERAYDAARQALARRLASHDAGRSPLGAPPWRFWASGPRFRLLGRPPPYNGGQLPSDPCSELLAARS
jgi:hypothetical protein